MRLSLPVIKMSRLVVLAIMLLAQFTNGVPAAKRIEKAGMIESHKMKEGPNESNGPSAKVALLTKNVTKVSKNASVFEAKACGVACSRVLIGSRGRAWRWCIMVLIWAASKLLRPPA